MMDELDDAGDEERGAPDRTGLPRPGTVIADRYRIEREIGSGGMAVVYAATQLGAGSRQVALKWLFQGRSNRDERRRRLLREARAASSIQHPNVVRVYDAGEHESGVYLVMELVVGESLASYLASRGKLSPRDAVDLLMPALRGVAAANKQGIIHRDLKPDNLILAGADRGKPELKVLDFGLSKLVGPAADSLHTLPGTLVGTPQYMAPEQADGRIGEVSARSDVYTLAAILYEAIAGRKPFESETLAGHLMKLAREEPTPIRELVDVPEDLADMIMWALQREPEARPRDVEEFARGLEPFGTVPFSIHPRSSEARGSVRAPASIRAPKPTPKSAAPPPTETSSLPAAKAGLPTRVFIAVGVVALVVILVGVALRGGDEPQEPEPERASAPAPAPAEPQLAAPPQATAATAAETSPPAKPVAPDASVATAEPAATTKHAEPRRARPAAEAPPHPTAAPEPPARERAPARPKRSPGVAYPWDEP